MKKQMIATLAILMLASGGFASQKSVAPKPTEVSAGSKKEKTAETKEARVQELLERPDMKVLADNIVAKIAVNSAETIRAIFKTAYARSSEAGNKMILSLRALEAEMGNLTSPQKEKIAELMENISVTSLEQGEKTPKQKAEVIENMKVMEAFMEALPGVLKSGTKETIDAWLAKIDSINLVMREGKLLIDQAIVDKRALTKEEIDKLLKCVKG